MTDQKTLAVYSAKADDYRNMVDKGGPDSHLKAFIDALPPGARVLDLGCGPGHALARMMEAGLAAEGLDPVPEFVAQASAASGAEVTEGHFEAMAEMGTYDGVYANFSLLHARKADMPDHLARVAAALTSGGIFHIGTKTGAGERRDALGRFYAYYKIDELRGLLEEAGFDVIDTSTGEEPGLDGTLATWVVMLARKTR